MPTPPVKLPTAEGANATLMVQLAPEARLLVQVVVLLKLLLIAIPAMLTRSALVFVRVSVWGALLVPTACPEKVR
jgi:hypothetical protein